jgi:uncharacterized protein
VALADGAVGFTADALIDKLRLLAADIAPIGLVYGAGFEDRPAILAELAKHWRIIGNLPDVVARAKDPGEVARTCRRLSIPHPAIASDRPEHPEHWLIKQAGGSGGAHIFSVHARALAKGEYYQQRVAGTPVSVLLLGDGRGAIALGSSSQWAAPCAAQMFRYGGAVRPADPVPACVADLCDAALQIAQAFCLCGLNSIDFLVAGDAFHLIEINPRPGATLDIFADAEGRLLRAHVEACAGTLPRAPLHFVAAAASATVYAESDLAAMPAFEWPAWCHDRQKPATHVARDEPVCTIVAAADTPSLARARVVARQADFLRRVAAKTAMMSAI